MESAIASLSQYFDVLMKNHGVLVLEAFLVVFGSLLIDFIQRRLLNRLAIQLKKTTTPWDDAFLDSVRRPLSIVIWVVGVTFAAQILAGFRNTAPLSVMWWDRHEPWRSSPSAPGF